MSFFHQLGFQCPKRKGVADFLQEVTSTKDQQVRSLGPGPPGGGGALLAKTLLSVRLVQKIAPKHCKLLY